MTSSPDHSGEDAPPSIHVMILAGGIGSRFWPASTPARPKQLLSLASPAPLIVDTVARARKLVEDDHLAVLTGEHLVGPFQAGLPDLPPSSFWVEPQARGTAPVLAWAAHRIFEQDPEGVMISLHADHLISPESAFVELLPRVAALAASQELLLTLAAPPDRPETGFGYIRPGAPLEAEGLNGWRVGAFVEKPDRETAVRYLEEGYLWNTGIFVWPVRLFLDELRAHAPEVSDALIHLDRGDEEAFFSSVTPISVDRAVLERSERVATVAATFRWDDVGGWEALGRSLPADPQGNVTVGEAHLVESTNSVVWAEDGPVVLFGMQDVVVVRSGGVTFVAPRERTPELKTLLEQLPDRIRKGG